MVNVSKEDIFKEQSRSMCQVRQENDGKFSVQNVVMGAWQLCRNKEKEFDSGKRFYLREMC